MNSETVKTITGKVSYAEKIALPENSTLHVSLLDVTIVDAPAKVLAEQIIPDATNWQRFALQYRAVDAKDGHQYEIRARITTDEFLVCTNTQPYTVRLGLTRRKPRQVLVDFVWQRLNA